MNLFPASASYSAKKRLPPAPDEIRLRFRMKLFTLDNRLILHRTGSLSRTDQRAVSAAVGKISAA